MDSTTNLNAAKKLDPQIKSVVTSAQQVAIYEFYDNQWKKSGHEGALLLCDREGPADYICVVILDQQKPQNFVEHIRAGCSLQRKGEYILYKMASADEVRAVWFYEQKECDRVFAEMKKLINRGPAAQGAQDAKTPTAPPAAASATVAWPPARSPMSKAQATPPDSKRASGKELMSMLASAKKDFGQKAMVSGKERGPGAVAAPQGPTSVPAGGDTRALHHSSSSLPVENLIQTVASARNGAAGDFTSPGIVTGAGIPMGGAIGGNVRTPPLASANVVMPGMGIIPTMGKGRGRTNPSDVPPALQRLLGSGSAGPQGASAFTSVVGRSNPMAPGGMAPVADSPFSAVQQDVKVYGIAAGAQQAVPIQSRPPMSPPVFDADAALQQESNLLAPSDLITADGGMGDLVRPVPISGAAPQFSSLAMVGEPTSQNNAPVGATGPTMDRFGMNDEQFVSAFMRLMDRYPSLVDAIDQALCRRRLEREYAGRNPRKN